MIVTTITDDPDKFITLFDRLLRKMGYVNISERAYVHQGGEQLTATITFRKVYLPEIEEIKECLTLHLSDAEHAINQELCNELNKELAAKSSEDTILL